MKFKKAKRLFSSSKKVESANSPANSPSETNKKKPRPNHKHETRSPNRILGVAAGLKEFMKKHCKQAFPSDQVPLRSYLLCSCYKGKKLRAETSTLASSLSLNRDETRSLRVTLESCFSFRNDNATPAVLSHDLPELNTRQDSDKSKVSASDYGTPENPKELEAPHFQALLHMTSAPRMSISGDSTSFSHYWSELNTSQGSDKSKVSTCDSSTLENPQELEAPHVQALLHMSRAPRMSFYHDLPDLNARQDSGKSKVSPPCDSGTPENPVEPEPPHFQALPHMASAPRKRFYGDNKSFSHELSAEGVKPFPLRKPARSNSWEDVMNIIKAKFNIAKEEVNVDLKQFSEDLVRISKDNAKSHHELKVIVGDFMILTQKCTKTTSGEFWHDCEKIVQELDVKRQELPPGVPKQLHTRLLFILTRCTRLLQFQSLKESWRQEEEFAQLSKSGPLSSPHNETSCHRLPSLVSTGVKEATNDLSHEHMSITIDKKTIICRICEEDVPTIHVEDHSKICELADKIDLKGESIDARLEEVALTLDNIIEIFRITAAKSPMKISNESLTGESDVLSAKLSGCSRSGSEDMLDCFGPKSDHGMTTPSASRMTPRSTRPDLFELLLEVKATFHDRDDIPQMTALANIARRAEIDDADDCTFMNVLLSCLRDLRVTINRRKFDALTVETFGTRIEKLIRAKYLQLNEIVDDGKVDLASTVVDEDVLLKDDADQRSLRTKPVHMRDRTSIDDFEEIKEISRGAYGRVLLAKKRTTGDIFAIKVLKKADMIRKNAVERIRAERDILISVRNPFVVRFFYSFTCRENLYLVMEYVNGGDIFSLLKTVGRLEEPLARVYIAEVVLALEYLHSEGVVHRDLKPDNLLIAHDGHVKLTDFGLSEVGLIDSTGDLSGPVLSEEKPNLQTSEHKLEKRSARGTPDYLAPEILLGTGHGATADWWSVGIILFEFIVGVPPFNADNPEQIFDNILDRKIPWPSVQDNMSYEVRDLIDRLLAKDPHQRLGARGAAEVKQHIFFKDINWDNLPKQKAVFVPDTKDPLDTSYFQSRYPSGKGSSPINENEKSCESCSSSCLSNDHNDEVDERGGPAELKTIVSEKNSFDNFSYKNLSQLACINYDLVSKGQKHGISTTLYPRQQKN